MLIWGPGEAHLQNRVDLRALQPANQKSGGGTACVNAHEMTARKGGLSVPKTPPSSPKTAPVVAVVQVV